MLQTRIGGMRFLSETSTRTKSLKKLDCFGKISSVVFLRTGNKLVCYFQLFARGDVQIVFGGKCKGSHFEFFADEVVRGNAVQIVPNFPAKSLSIYRAHFFLTPFNYLINLC